MLNTPDRTHRTGRPGPNRRGLLGAGLLTGLCGLGWPGSTKAEVPQPDAGSGTIEGRNDGLSTILDANARPVTLYEGGRWCEGPVWAPHLGGLIFSDVRADRMLVLPVGGPAETFRAPSGNANGNTLDAQGRLITCEHRKSRVVRREPDGHLTVLAERFEGRRLNSPNDVVVARDGAIWFTDPTFGIESGEEGEPRPSEQRGRFVFRLDPGGRLAVVADGFAQPNGLAFSPDGAILYVSEAVSALKPDGPREIRAFDVADGEKLVRERVFATLKEGVPDGLKTDAHGRVYAGAGEGVQIWEPDGTWIGRIATPGPCANVAFGGPGGQRLFLCASDRVLAVDLKVRGAGF